MITKYKQFVFENTQAQVVQPQPAQQPQVQLVDEKQIRNKIAKITEYTSISTSLIKENIKAIVDEAVLNNFYGVCVNPEFVDYVVYELEDNPIKVISTLDFPDGKSPQSERMVECIKIISDGVDEIDLSIDIEEFKKSYLEEDDTKHSDYTNIINDIKEIADECHKKGVVLKVIIETCLLSFDELKDICYILSKSNVDFAQTSSGTKGDGVDLEKIKEIRRLLPDHIKIKASGGIRTIEKANTLYPYVDRIGTSVILK